MGAGSMGEGGGSVTGGGAFDRCQSTGLTQGIGTCGLQCIDWKKSGVGGEWMDDC